MCANLRVRTVSAISLLVLTAGVSVCAGQVLYVDVDAAGANDGSSWADAYVHLQDALSAASSGDQVHVAEGVYTPDLGASVAPGDREATFLIGNGVKLVGGYAGFGAADGDLRDTTVFESILSGDLNGDDIGAAEPGQMLYQPSRSDNSARIVTTAEGKAAILLDGFTITGGNGRDGSGVWDNPGAFTVANCTFTRNAAAEEGGALYSHSYYGSDGPTIVGCVFYFNAAGENGGAVKNHYSSPTITNCVFIRNRAEDQGGAIKCIGSDSTVAGCLFSGNHAGNDGGAVQVASYSDSSIINCTFSRNSAAYGGAAVVHINSSLSLTNCIFADDKAEVGNEIGVQFSTWSPSTTSIRHCTIKGGAAQVHVSSGGGISWGGGNIWSDPLLVDADGPDNTAGTLDDNVRLRAGSPCIDAGSPADLPASDLDGEARILGDAVDIGAYEGPKQALLLSTQQVVVPEGGVAEVTVALAADPKTTLGVLVSRESGDSDISVVSGDVLTFNSANYHDPQVVTLAAADDGDYQNGSALFRISAVFRTSGPGLPTAGVTAREADNDPAPNVLFVDANASGLNTGVNWADAFTDLGHALDTASSFPSVGEIRVAWGTYRPAGPGGDRTASFRLIDDVAIRGGYAGSNGGDPDARDIETYRTILSGDLNGDDGVDFSNNAENSFHVVVSEGSAESAVLEGFTITAGNANGTYATKNDLGGGMFNDSSSPTVIDCTFAANAAARSGAGAYNLKSSPVFRNCRFLGNSPGSSYGGYGSGMYNGEGSGPLLVDCIFSRNVSNSNGGAMNNRQSSPTLLNCCFTENVARLHGGGMYNWSGNPVLTNCVFAGNVSHGASGAMANIYTSPILTNCTIVGNKAFGSTGGISAGTGSGPKLANCIVWGNVDVDGTGESSQITGAASINYCCVQGWTGSIAGPGNHGEDPLFVLPCKWDDRGTGYDNWDDIWTAGDYRLISTSPCIDAGINSVVPLDTADLDGDGDKGEVLPVDAGHGPRFVDDVRSPDVGIGTPPLVDMGAFEGPSQGFLLSERAIAVPEGGAAAFTVALSMDPLGLVEVIVTIESDDPDITVSWEEGFTFDSSNFFVPREVSLSAAQDGDNLDGSAVIRLSAAGLTDAEIVATERDDECVCEVLHVDSRAAGRNNGSNWADAYVSLQDALGVAREHEDVHTILVSQGTYAPAEPNGNRHSSFLVATGIAIKGGYAGAGGPDADARDIREYATILSGDLNGDDGLGSGGNAENSHHVVKVVASKRPTLVDGFTITGGNADEQYEARGDCGGGMDVAYAPDCSYVTVTNCTFIANRALAGGALYTNCQVLKVGNCVFLGNSAEQGGGVYAGGGDTLLTNCLFFDNVAKSGGGIFCPCTNVTLYHCTLVSNRATGADFYRGGGICGDDDTEMDLTNCIFWANTDIDGVGPQAQIDHDSRWQTRVNYCCIEGWTGELGGDGNIGDDPLFIDAGNGDYRLSPGSPCIDAGTDTGQDADIDGNIRPFDFPGLDNNGPLPDFDIGAYEAVTATETTLWILPKLINRSGPLEQIMAFLSLSGTAADPIDGAQTLLLHPGGIEAVHQYSISRDDRTVVFAFFRKADLMDAVPQNGKVRLTLEGLLKSGRKFFAEDTVIIFSFSGPDRPLDFDYIERLSRQWLRTGPDLDTDLDKSGRVDFTDFSIFTSCTPEPDTQ